MSVMQRLSIGRKVTLWVATHPKALNIVQKGYKLKLKLPRGYQKIVKK